MRPLVYVAGPISKGDTEENVRRAFDVAEAMMAIPGGPVPYVPHNDQEWQGDGQ